MTRRLHFAPRSMRERSAAAFLLAISLTSCTHTKTPSASPTATPLHAVSAQVAGQDSRKHIVLPNPALLGCNTANCTQLFPDEDAGPGAIHPWQVSVDFTDGKVIGLMAFYDQPATIDDVQAAIDERYGQWAMADFRTGPVRLWRVDPPHKFAIQLSGAYGGTLLIYLTYDPKHPMSDGAEPYWDCLVEKSVQCAAHLRRTSRVPDLLR